MDQLTISGLSVLTKIGVHQWEQAIDQRLLIDITIPTDVSNCQDELTNTIDYDQLCQQVTTYVESNQFALIETVACRVAQLIKDQFTVNQLTIRVAKPQAIKNAANVAITVTR
jgi:dihydroneopterin aldolase